MTPRLLLLPFLLALGSGCDGTGLSPAWRLDRLRVLGVKAEPAEPRPGDTVTFESFVYTPPGVELEGVLWFGCLPSEANDFGCAIDESVLAELAGADPEELTAEELAELYEAAVEAGLIGFEPLLPPTWEAPAEALDGLEGDALLEGRSAIVNITAIPAGAETDADFELAYKRVPVSLAETPNHNPTITGFLVNGVQVDPGGTFLGKVGVPYELEPLMSEDSIEDYDYVSRDGTRETRTEEPYFTWYTEDGSFDQEYSLHPYTSVAWSSGGAATNEVRVVMRDRRGGMDFATLYIQTECVFPAGLIDPCSL